MRTGLLIAKSVWVQVEVGRRLGIEGAALDALGLSAAALQAPEAMVPAGAIYRHLELMAARMPAEELVVEVATAHGATSLGPVGLAMRAAPTARRALGILLRYQHLMNTVARFDAVEEGDVLVLTEEERVGPDGLGRLLASEVAMLSSLHWARGLLGRPLDAVTMAVPRRGRFPRYEALVGCAVVGGAPRARLGLPAATLDDPLPTADVALAVFFDELLGERAAEHAGDDDEALVRAVRRQVAQELPEGAPSLAAIAERLGLSTRTLQRRLAGAGQRFSQVVDDVRHDLALTHLANPTLAVSEIAFMLGFDEVASFHRAFRRWQGTTPGAFRARQKLAGGR